MLLHVAHPAGAAKPHPPPKHGHPSATGARCAAHPPRPRLLATARLGAQLPARMPCSVGKTLYVAPTGSDRAPCSKRRPCATIDRAFDRARSGTTINLRGGTYSGFQVVQSRRFSPGNPVTLQSYPGERATFTGCPESCSRNILYFGNTTGIRVRNIVVTGTNSRGSAIKIDDASYLELDHVVIHDVFGNGMLVVGDSVRGFARTYCDHIQIWNTTIYHAGMSGDDGAGPQGIYMGSGEYSDGVKHGVDGFVIANSLLYAQPAGYALQLGNEAANGYVVNNTFDGADSTAKNHGSSIVVWGKGDFPTNHIVIANNIFTNNANRAVQANSDRPLDGIVVTNNLAYNNGVSPAYLGMYGDVVAFVPGTNRTGSDPRYSDPSGGDFRLRHGSPARGGGLPALTPQYDRELRPRLAPSLGAYAH